MSNSNTPISPEDIQLLRDIKVPENLDVGSVSFPIDVFNKADDRLMGVATFFNGDITSFKRTSTSSDKDPNAVDLGILRLDLTTYLRITLDGVYSPRMTGTVEIVSGFTVTPLPMDMPVQWTVELFDEAGSLFYSRSIVNGSARNQELVELAWFGTVKVTAKAMKLYGEMEQEKLPSSNLADLITVTVLDGLYLPEWASGF